MGKNQLNKPDLRQFMVVKSYYEHGLLKDEHVFTTDSLKEAVITAYKSLGKDYIISVEMYEADGKTRVKIFYTSDLMSLYGIKEYLK